jgi:hypothetical protein
MKDEQKTKAAATEEARRLLLRLHIHSWNEPAFSRVREHQVAIEALEIILSETKQALSAIEQLLKIIIPALKQTRPAIEEGRGQSHKLFEPRDQLIVKALTTICLNFDLSQEAGRPIIAEALRQNGIDLDEDGIKTVCERFRKRAKKPPQ